MLFIYCIAGNLHEGLIFVPFMSCEPFLKMKNGKQSV